ncbi:MAG: hypothetical protein ACJAXA_003368 [Candidatus Aldehydirespiratoraceae bacterium]|jgi:hypothetical protein
MPLEVERDPEADVLVAVDAVTRLVVMRGGSLGRSGLLDHDVFMKEADFG